MMNQRIVIYIFLSAVLLYLYYVRRDLAIFAVFVVVVGSTLIFRDGGASASEGFGSKESKKTGDKTKNLDDKKEKTGTKKDSIKDAKDEDKDDDKDDDKNKNKNKNKKKTKTSNADDNKAADDNEDE